MIHMMEVKFVSCETQKRQLQMKLPFYYIFLLIFQYFNGIVDIHSYDDRILTTAIRKAIYYERVRKDHRKEQKRKQNETG